MLPRPANREDAARGVVVVDAVLQLAPPELQDPERGLEVAADGNEGRIARRVRGHDPVRRFHLGDGLGHAALVREELSQLLVRLSDGGEVAPLRRHGLQLVEVSPGRGQRRSLGLLARGADGGQVRARRRDLEEPGHLGAARDLHHDLVIAGSGRPPVPVRDVGDALGRRRPFAPGHRHRRQKPGPDEPAPLEPHAERDSTCPGRARRSRGTAPSRRRRAGSPRPPARTRRTSGSRRPPAARRSPCPSTSCTGP